VLSRHQDDRFFHRRRGAQLEHKLSPRILLGATDLFCFGSRGADRGIARRRARRAMTGECHALEFNGKR
jgi:hypothetical protein